MNTDAAKKRRMATEDEGMASGVENLIAEMKDQMLGMQNKIDALESKTESLERGMKILVKERSAWKYSAPDIPSSHWEEAYFDDDYVSEMEDFMKRLKGATCALRSGYCSDIELNEGGYLLRFDYELLPHWKELAIALHLYQAINTSTITKVKFSNIELSPYVIALLGPALKGNKIEDFGLFRNNFADSRKGIEFAVDRIKDNQNMSRFMWSSNRIDSIEDVSYLVEAIIGNPSITTVRLDHSFGHDINGYDILCDLFTCGKSFSMIQMSGNNVCPVNSVFSDRLSNNLPLEELYLTDNALSDADALLIAGALKHNNKLRKLHLDDNHFTETGRVALEKAVHDYDSLHSLFDCNHTCRISGVEKNIIWNWSDDPISNRENKIFTLLRMRNEEG